MMTATAPGRVPLRRAGGSLTWQRQGSTGPLPGNICKFWLAGNCKRNPCRFVHPDRVAPVKANGSKCKQSHGSPKLLKTVHRRLTEEQKLPKRKQSISPKEVVDGCDPSQSVEKAACVTHNEANSKKMQPKICKYWLKDSCVHGDKCKYLHSWSYGDGIVRLAQLEGHKKAVTGITLPSGSEQLFTGSKDGTVRIWNCHTGECTSVGDMGSPVGCLISEGQWVFAGITDAVKAWNIQTKAELTLSAPAGQVYSLAVSDTLLFAGVHDGSIYVWKFSSEATSSDATASLKGHSGAVVSLIVGHNRLYSGSMDNTIRVWDLENMKCIHTLQKHSEVVMSMLCCDSYLLSSSLDHTLKVWAATESGELDVTYTHDEEQGILSLCGMHDAAEKPILLCSCNDNTVRLYELPSFVERGRLFTRQEVRSIHSGPGGLCFTGDGSGLVSVWKFA